MRWVCLLPIIIGLVLGSVYEACAQMPVKVVVAEGMAAGSDLKARDEAINRALRRAVEQGVGTLIDSESMTQNYQLLDDRIYSDVKGYVKEYKIISDNNGEGGVYKIKVEAVVALARLSKDLKALNIIRERKGNPRIMVLVQEFVDGLEQPSELVQTEMERVFLSKGFPMVDKGQFQMIKERDVALCYDNLQKAAVLGREFGAEVIVVGQATSNLLESSRPYGVAVFGYTADITAKAIKTDTAALMVSDSVSATERGSGRMPTANKSLRNSGQKLARAMMEGILEGWRSEVFNVVTVQLVIDKMEAQDRSVLKGDLESIRGVQGVYERSFNKGILVMELKVDGAIWQGFEERMLRLPNIKLELVAKTENRIELKKIPFMLQSE